MPTLSWPSAKRYPSDLWDCIIKRLCATVACLMHLGLLENCSIQYKCESCSFTYVSCKFVFDFFARKKTFKRHFPLLIGDKKSFLGASHIARSASCRPSPNLASANTSSSKTIHDRNQFLVLAEALGKSLNCHSRFAFPDRPEFFNETLPKTELFPFRPLSEWKIDSHAQRGRKL